MARGLAGGFGAAPQAPSGVGRVSPERAWEGREGRAAAHGAHTWLGSCSSVQEQGTGWQGSVVHPATALGGVGVCVASLNQPSSMGLCWWCQGSWHHE